MIGLKRVRPIVAAITLAGILVPATTAGTAAAASPHRSVTPRAAGASVAWHHCGKALQCADVRVPLDWDHPHGRKI